MLEKEDIRDKLEDTESGYVHSVPPDPRRLDPLDNSRIVEEGCLGITQEKKYYEFLDPNGSVFVKRNLTPSEYLVNLAGNLVLPIMCPERIKNEIATIKFIQSNTTIPTPNIRCSFEDNGRIYIITDIVPGVAMSQLEEHQKPTVVKELEGYIEQMHALKSKKMGGVCGDVIFPYRFENLWPQYEGLKVRDADTPEFVLCHNDLSQYNIIVDQETLKINAILDWEYAGFFPPEFDSPFYRRLGHSGALEGEEDDVPKLWKVVEHWRV
ncbi:hypothetical protein GALMADRAFT_222534 [Galerina marginata CBS 339.88]|uniref:Aminoglycoside phosphotransferase domain-containing protein n=1 Tax=Galerina marginata (strain CBS 339.88) TaxID=685588 RepID=A0A067TCN5_GALM3|nr:hypothetical protein GALMADRAFT_222534 [Galerina marginata CBS 339.88]